MYVTQDIADRIKWRLKEKGIRTKDMLSDLNMGINAISEFAKGKQMSCIALARIADYLDCSVDYLLGRTNWYSALWIPPTSTRHTPASARLASACSIWLGTHVTPRLKVT